MERSTLPLFRKMVPFKTSACNLFLCTNVGTGVSLRHHLKHETGQEECKAYKKWNITNGYQDQESSVLIFCSKCILQNVLNSRDQQRHSMPELTPRLDLYSKVFDVPLKGTYNYEEQHAKWKWSVLSQATVQRPNGLVQTKTQISLHETRNRTQQSISQNSQGQPHGLHCNH